MAAYGKIFSHAFRYGFSKDRLLPYSILYVIMLIVLFASLDVVFSFFLSALQSGAASFFFSFIGLVFGVGVVFIVFALVSLFFQAAIMDNARHAWSGKQKPLSASYGIAKERYVRVLGASILVGIISFALGLIPLLGFVLAFVAGWVFLVVVPCVVIGGKRATEALGASYDLFKAHKLNVFVFWLLLLVLGSLLFAVALIPVVVVALPIIVLFFQILFLQGNVAALLPMIKANLVMLFIGGVISSVLLAYKKVFQESALAFFYLDVSKKRKKST